MALVTLPEVKKHLNIPESDTTNDSELGLFINAATPIVEHIVGPIEARTVTETHCPNGRMNICLREVPVLSVTTVVEYLGTQEFALTDQPLGTESPDQYGYSLDNLNAGLLRRRANGYPVSFRGEVVVTYEAGRLSTPDNVKLAALEDIRALWTQTQVAARPQFGGGGVVMGPDNWNQDLHLFPRLAYLVESERFIEGVA